MTRPSCPECGRDDVACAMLTVSGVSPCEVARWRRLEAERDEARAEAERLREALRETAEAQREACARATEETWPENPVRAARIRATPLVAMPGRDSDVP